MPPSSRRQRRARMEMEEATVQGNVRIRGGGGQPGLEEQTMTRTDPLIGSLEGTLRQPGEVRTPAGETTPPAPIDSPRAECAPPRAAEQESPFVLYGRLGYIPRALIQPH